MHAANANEYAVYGWHTPHLVEGCFGILIKRDQNPVQACPVKFLPIRQLTVGYENVLTCSKPCVDNWELIPVLLCAGCCDALCITFWVIHASCTGPLARTSQNRHQDLTRCTISSGIGNGCRANFVPVIRPFGTVCQCKVHLLPKRCYTAHCSNQHKARLETPVHMWVLHAMV